MAKNYVWGGVFNALKSASPEPVSVDTLKTLVENDAQLPLYIFHIRKLPGVEVKTHREGKRAVGYSLKTVEAPVAATEPAQEPVANTAVAAAATEPMFIIPPAGGAIIDLTSFEESEEESILGDYDVHNDSSVVIEDVLAGVA